MAVFEQRPSGRWDMSVPELEALRERLIQTASEIDLAVEAIEKILMPIGPELDPPKKVQWGKGDRAMEDLEDFLKRAKPTTIRVDESVLVDRAARRMRGEVLDPLVYETGMVETDVEPADELKGVFDRLRDSEK